MKRNAEAGRSRRGARRKKVGIDLEIAEEWVAGYFEGMEEKLPPAIDPKLLEDPVFRELMEEGLKIQHRFSAEPIYARTGRGYLKSEGVEELQRIKKRTNEVES